MRLADVYSDDSNFRSYITLDFVSDYHYLVSTSHSFKGFFALQSIFYMNVIMILFQRSMKLFFLRNSLHTTCNAYNLYVIYLFHPSSCLEDILFWLCFLDVPPDKSLGCIISTSSWGFFIQLVFLWTSVEGRRWYHWIWFICCCWMGYRCVFFKQLIRCNKFGIYCSP